MKPTNASALPVCAPGWEAIYQRTLDCVHCGLCLQSCPTYRVSGREQASPRGRIHLLRATAEGRVAPGALLAEEAFACLACRACETACPSGVRFGALIEEARAQIDADGLRRGPARFFERLGLRGLVVRPRILHALVSLLAVAQRSGLLAGLGRIAPAPLAAPLALLPRIPSARERAALPEWSPARGRRRGRVALLRGCIASEFFADVNRASLRLLTRNGWEVWTPPEQQCCGALHAHAGDRHFAEELARRNLRAFSAQAFDALLVNSAGCGAALRDYERWLPEGGETLSGRVRDLGEFLVREGFEAPRGRIEARVCYDDPCHLAHGMGVREAPRKLLASIPGIELVPHADPESCCGAAGIYNLTHPGLANAVLARKLDALAAARPDLVATGNPGCAMQLAAGARARGLRVRVAHPLTLLDESYSLSVSTEIPSRRIL